MGKLLYAGGTASIEIDDRPLAHIRTVILAKLRRNESLAFTWESGAYGHPGKSTIWIHPAMPLQFDFYGSREVMLNRRWLDEMMATANSHAGLYVSAEPSFDVSLEEA